jgi:hypothetical protein
MVLTIQGVLQFYGNKIYMNNFNVIFLTDVFAGVWHGTLGLILLGPYYSKRYLRASYY